MPGQRVRNVERNIHFVNGSNDEIGGAYQNGSLSWAEMYQWMQIVYTLPFTDYALFPCQEVGDPKDPVANHGEAILMYANPTVIMPGYYILLSSHGAVIDIPINPEMPAPRSITRSVTGHNPRTSDFRKRVRARDGRCVITHRRPYANFNFVGLEATHIFPLAQIDSWRSGSWQQYITDDKYAGETGIHSVQNGILLASTVHADFDAYMVAIDPDNGFKTYCFAHRREYSKVPIYLNLDTPQKYQPSRALLKHHFRMAVLLNMKGRVGYPVWDENITPGMDQIAEISTSEQGKLRLETILAGKLNSLIC